MHYIEPYLQTEVGTGPCGNSATEMCPLAVAQRRCEQPPIGSVLGRCALCNARQGVEKGIAD